MSKVTLTLKDLEFTIKLQDKLTPNKNTKFGLALKNYNIKVYEEVFKEKYSKPLSRKQLELALTDKDEAVLYNVDEKGNQSFKYNKENTQLLNDEVERLFNEPIEFDFYITKYEKLSQEELNALFSNTDKFIYHDYMNEKTYKSLCYIISGLPVYVEPSLED